MKRQFKSQITLFWEKKKNMFQKTRYTKKTFSEKKNIKIILVVTFVSVGQIVN